MGVTLLLRNREDSTEPDTEVNTEVSTEVGAEVKRLINLLNNEMSRQEIQNKLKIKTAEYVRKKYIVPALKQNFIEMVFLSNPNHPNQKYRLTPKGKALQEKSNRIKRNNE